MKARYVNENYPLGAKDDPDAPWNEKDPDISINVNDYGEIVILYNSMEEIAIDPYQLEKHIAPKLGLDFDKLEDEGKGIEVYDINKIGSDIYEITTDKGNVEISLSDLESLL